MQVRRVQDSVHGLMEFRGMEAAVVDIASSAELQRLRRIKQLGLNYLVFPAAEHSRFSHSLGSAHLAIRFTNQVSSVAEQLLGDTLQVGPEDVRVMALAALCHDLGHGPLSHMWEREVIGDPFDRPAWNAALGLEGDQYAKGLSWHELATQGLLAWEGSDVRRRLERYEEGLADRVRGVLAGRYWLPYLPPLLRGDIDVDRCDFVARDALHTGAEYGALKLDWLISTITIGFDDERPVVGFDKRKAFRIVEQFLTARRALYDTVYQHKTVRSAEGMLGLWLRRLKELVREGNPPSFSNRGVAKPLLKLFKDGVFGPEDLVKLDDDALWLMVQDIATQTKCDPVLRDLARRILGRDLFKQVPVEPERVRSLARAGSTRARDLEELLRSELGIETPQYYFVVDELKLDLLQGDGDERPWIDNAYDGAARFVYSGEEGRPVAKVRGGELGMYDQSRQADRIFVPEEAVSAVRDLLSKT